MEWLTIVNTILIALIGIAVFLARNWILSKLRTQDKKQETDEKLFKELIGVLPPSSASIKFLSEHNMTDSFPGELRNPLWSFIEIFGNVDHAFHHRGIERRRKVLHVALSDFLSTLGNNTWRIPVSGDLYSVPEEWEYEQPDRVKEVEKNLNQQAISAYRAYCQLINYARSKLGC